MKTEEYISSGILEAYAIGDLSPADRLEVEKNISIYAELGQELSRIEEGQEKFLMQAAVQPRAYIKSNLINKINLTSPARTGHIPVRNNSVVWKYAMAASVALTLMASFLAYNYYGKWRKAETSFNELMEQNMRMASDYNTVNQRLDKIEKDVRIIDNPAFKRTVLNGTANAPDQMAFVYWDENTQEVYLSLQNMKALAEENQYQLWAIVDGKPVDVGLFDSGNEGLLQMKSTKGASAFAVTIEPRGGNASPTLEALQAVGNVIKS